MASCSLRTDRHQELRMAGPVGCWGAPTTLYYCRSCGVYGDQHVRHASGVHSESVTDHLALQTDVLLYE